MYLGPYYIDFLWKEFTAKSLWLTPPSNTETDFVIFRKTRRLNKTDTTFQFKPKPKAPEQYHRGLYGGFNATFDQI